jgi:hypothetical protein
MKKNMKKKRGIFVAFLPGHVDGKRFLFSVAFFEHVRC